MRPLEALFVAAVALSLVLRWMRPRGRQVSATMLAMIGILAALHLGFDSVRWEMVPAYVMAVVSAWILARDLQRVSGAKAGESARWVAVPSAAQRAGTGVALTIATLVAVLIPAWAFPRLSFPVPDGLYDTGRMDLSIADAARPGRAVSMTVWYPAETPNGRPLPYHPEPGRLGAALARGTALPAFTFRNLSAARTYSTNAPRFSIREGRSPLVVASTAVGGSRFDGTSVFERLASNGYVVVSVGEDSASQADRVADLRLALDHFLALPATGDTLSGHVRVDRVGLVGRGAGAAAAAELAAADSRVTAVVSIAPDGLGEVARRGVRRPFFVFTVSDLPGLADAMRYGGTEARLEAATAQSLADAALLSAPVRGMLGLESADAPRDVHGAVSALTLRFLDQYLKERRAETQVDLPARVHVRIIPHPPRAN